MAVAILRFPAAPARPRTLPTPTLRMEVRSIRERLAALALLRLKASQGVRS
jgi:hypothetical protein